MIKTPYFFSIFEKERKENSEKPQKRTIRENEQVLFCNIFNTSLFTNLPLGTMNKYAKQNSLPHSHIFRG